MAYNRQTARQLCTKAELELVLDSFADRLAMHTDKRLASKITRARALRDKYRDLLRRQRLANRARTGTKAGQRTGRTAGSPASNARTAEKAELFDETMARFSARLAKVRTASAASGARPAPMARSKAGESRSKPAGPRRAATRTPATAGSPKASVSPKAPAARVSRPTSPRAPAVRGFVSEQAAQASFRQRLQATGGKSVQAHVSSRGRRNQAKRDSRGR